MKLPYRHCVCVLPVSLCVCGRGLGRFGVICQTAITTYRIEALWYGMVNVDLYSAVITKVSNALNTLVSGEEPGFQTLSN